MFRKQFFAALALGLIAGTTAAADTPKGYYFRLERGTQTVEGIYVVNGYTQAEMRSMMRKYCKGGKIGELTPVGKARKKRGNLLQKFQTTCAGGMPDRFKGSVLGIEIEYITEGEYAGKHLAEITTSDGNGNIIYLRETLRP